MPNTIALKGRGIQKEAPAAAAGIVPGMLLQRESDGDFAIHATAGEADIPLLWAKENEVIGNGIDTAYAAADNLIAEVFPPGGEVYALVAASAAAIVIGDLLESAGDGTLRLFVATADLTDSTTGTAGGTLADGTATYSQTITNDNIASLAAKVNALLPEGAKKIVARALEAVDNSGGGTTARIKVEVV